MRCQPLRRALSNPANMVHIGDQMKPKIKILGKEISTFELSYVANTSCRARLGAWILSLAGNIVAGIIAAGILVSLNSFNLSELKRIELKNKKESVVWEARVQATKSNMAAFAKLHNYIEYEFEKELQEKLKTLAYLDNTKTNNRMYTFDGLNNVKKEVFDIVKSNNHFLSEDMAEYTTRFVNDVDSLVTLQLLTLISQELVDGIQFPVSELDNVQYSDEAQKHIASTVSWLKSNFELSYRSLEYKYRKSMFEISE
ncbi:hypothetical protein VCSRO100_3559 [Vibrio cholerae]|nr:hypothetical protein VCSRO100_3559 [Vibrio cholerae]